jgi:hypothetical protein
VLFFSSNAVVASSQVLVAYGLKKLKDGRQIVRMTTSRASRKAAPLCGQPSQITHDLKTSKFF